MEAIVTATVVGLIAGVVGTGLGAAGAAAIGRPSKRTLSFMMGLAGGVMLAVVFLDVVPEALNTGGALTTMAGFVFGVVALGVADLFMPHLHIASDCRENSRYLRTGILTAIGIAMHNLPEGLAIGAGYALGSSLGFSVALTIALHNIPEGMAMAAPMCAARVSPGHVTLVGGMAGLPMALGAAVGAAFGSVSPVILTLCLGFAGGAMMFITADELIPEAQRISDGHSGTFGIVVGVLLGMMVVLSA